MWNYGKQYLDVLMPGYIHRLVRKYNHSAPRRQQYCPYLPQPRQYGAAAQTPILHDESPCLNDIRKKRVQQVVGSLLYYARVVDLTMLMALSSIVQEKSKVTEGMEARVNQLLDYCALHPEATIHFYASKMILNIHSDALYLSEPNSRSRASENYFLGWMPCWGDPIRINGTVLTLCNVLRCVAASVAEAELGALFMNCKEGSILCPILKEMGHKHPPTPVHCDNSTAVSIANDTVKRQRSRSMEMQYF